jgi:hypothetical protein
LTEDRRETFSDENVSDDGCGSCLSGGGPKLALT